MTTITNKNYGANITKDADGWFVVVCYYQANATDQIVCPDFKARSFKTKKAAIKAANAYLSKI